MKGVSVQFQDVNSGSYIGKDYEYKCLDDGIKEGELCVVQVKKTDDRAVLCVVKVTDVHEGFSGQATAWIICKVDLDNHLAFVARQAKKLSLKRALDARISQLSSKEFYKQFAATDSAVAKLLAELNDLEEEAT